jgi:hypothetical protein
MGYKLLEEKNEKEISFGGITGYSVGSRIFSRADNHIASDGN